MDGPAMPNGRRPRGRLDLAVALSIGVAIFVLVAVPRGWDHMADAMMGWPGFGELLGISIVLLCATAVVGVHRGRVAVREQELRQQAEARFRALVEESPAIVYTWDPARHVHTYVSPQIEPILGYTPAEWSEGEIWLSAIHPDDVDDIRGRSEAADRDPAAHFSAEFRVLTKDGRTVWVRSESRNVQLDDAGLPSLAQGVMYDITARHEADERAGQAEARFQTMVERVPAVSYVWDGGTEPGAEPAAYISPQIRGLLGYSPDDWLAHPERWAERVDPDHIERVLSVWADAVEAGSPFSVEYRMQREDGRWVWIRDEANPVGPGSNGAPLYQGVLFDVTERRTAEDRLREAEERWRLLLEHLPVTAYMIEYAADGSETVYDRWIGPGITALIGATPDEWVAQDDAWGDALHPEDRDWVKERWGEAVRTGEPFEADYRLRRRDGSIAWAHEESAVVNRDGRIRAEGVFIDITGRHEAETALRAAEHRFRALVEQLPAIVFLEDPVTGEPTYVSPQIQAIFGYSAAEWMADPDLWKERLHPDDRERVLASDTADTGDSWSVDYRTLARDGHVIWVHNEARRIRDDQGEPIYWLGIVSDITDRKHAEERIRQAEERYRSLVEQLPVAVYTDAVDELSTALYISPRYEQLTGYTPEQRLLDPGLWARILHPEDRERVLAESQRTNASGDPFDIEYRVVTEDGRIVWLHDYAILVEGTDGSPIWQGVLQNVTDEHVAQVALARRDAILQSAGLAAERFLRSGSWRDVLDEVLASLGAAGAASRAYVYENLDVDGEPGVALSYVWCASPEVTLPSYVPGRTSRWNDGFARWTDVLGAGEVLHGSVATFPEGERETLEALGVRTVLAVPIIVDGLWWGYVGLDECGEDRPWHDAEIEALTVTASTLAAAIGRERAAAVLAESERRFQTLVEQTPAVTYLDEVDPERADGWHTVYLSPQAAEVFGVPMEVWQNASSAWSELVHPDDRARAAEADAAHYAEGEPLDIEMRIIRPDGEVRWVRDQAVIVPDDDGRHRWSQGILMDVTDRRAAEEALREAEERYRGIVEHVPAAIYLDRADASMVSVYMSPQIEAIVGVTSEQWLADPDLWLTLMDPEDREAVRNGYLESARAGRPWEAEYRLHTPDGRTIWIHDETTFLHDHDGVPIYLQGVLMDITDRKRAEQALRESERREREAADRLRALDDMKNTFLAAVSHELRSPLTSILGLSLTLERATELTEDDRGDLLVRLAANARKLDRLLKDLLDIDRLNRGIVEPQVRPSDVGAIARRTVEALDHLAGREVIVQAEPVEISVDPAKVERIIENLLMNAARHTGAESKIWLRVEAKDGGALIAVEDDGPGVPDEIRSAIFEPFRQGPTTSPHSPGTGIGLSLVARFAELHGGHAWVEEREGGGASFRVFLPNAGTLPLHYSNGGGHRTRIARTG